MTRTSLSRAVREDHRFLAAARAVKEGDGGSEWYDPSKETGAVKRASMDLTRALAEMRKRG